MLNAAIKLKGEYPVKIEIRKLKEYHIEFESQDVDAFGIITSANEIQDCQNPYDLFALHKAALIVCGIIPFQGQCNLQSVLEELGGGIYLSTQVLDVPKGSGLGTSSILSAACVKGIFQFLGKEISFSDICEKVLCMEQMMSTGGGWQDQIGGITDGIKLITSMPGIHQNVKVEEILLPQYARQELQERFALIYTGQRRLARNLLRDVIGGYIGGKESSVLALSNIQEVAVLMRFALERGNITMFARLLNEHWELSKQLDAGTTNTCIDQIFMVCDDLIDGKFIAGAGGGGFLQVILKKGVTRKQLSTRLQEVFQNSGVDVWDCEILF